MNSAIIAMKQGKGHSLGYLSDARIINMLKKSKNLKLTQTGYEGIAAVYFLEFNLRRDKFKDIRVRQAIAHSIDLDFITKKLHRGFSRQSTGPIHSKSLFFTDQVTTYPLDLEKANQLLDDAGYPRKEDGTRFSATLEWFPGEPALMKNVAEYLKPQLKKVGIDIQLKAPAGFLPWMMRIGNWEHDLTLNNYFMWGDPMIGVHRIFHSDNIRKQVWTNTSGYKNSKVDKLIEAAAEEMDFEKRKTLYAEFQKIISEDLPLYFTYEAPYHTAYHVNLRNVPLKSIWGAATPNDKIYWKDGRSPK
jgi:peptide/nickel transport system substrate-binding protein